VTALGLTFCAVIVDCSTPAPPNQNAKIERNPNWYVNRLIEGATVAQFAVTALGLKLTPPLAKVGATVAQFAVTALGLKLTPPLAKVGATVAQFAVTALGLKFTEPIFKEGEATDQETDTGFGASNTAPICIVGAIVVHARIIGVGVKVNDALATGVTIDQFVATGLGVKLTAPIPNVGATVVQFAVTALGTTFGFDELEKSSSNHCPMIKLMPVTSHETN
jgi:mannose/fructose/N-acetylgalactosamine-specific phosphotransferase system component IID